MAWTKTGNIRGPGTLVQAKKTSPQTITATATNVVGMGWELEANSTYIIRMVIPTTTVTGTSPTLTFSFTGPPSPTLFMLRRYQMTSANAAAVSVITSPTAFGNGALVANQVHTIEGVIVTGAAGGLLQLRAQCGGTSPTVVIPAGAAGHAEKVA